MGEFVGAAPSGHDAGWQNGGISVGRLHDGCMRPSIHWHTQAAWAFVVKNVTNARVPRG